MIALDAVNLVRDYVEDRKLIEAKIELNPSAIADHAIRLMDFSSNKKPDVTI